MPHRSLPFQVAAIVLGYTTDVNVSRGWRLVLTAAFVAAGAFVFVATRTFSSSELRPTQGNVRVLARLEDYTKSRDQKFGNTIPTFLLLPGKLGVLIAEAAPNAEPAPDLPEPAEDSVPQEAIQPLSESELQKGFCTPNVSRLVRQQYPGAYDDMSDAELQKRVLAKRPEYKDRLCVLPVWIATAPRNIVKYELVPAAFTIRGPVGPWAVLATAAFAIVALNVYYRLLAPRFN